MGYSYKAVPDDAAHKGSVEAFAQLEKELAGFVALAPHEWDGESVKKFLSNFVAEDKLKEYGEGSAKTFNQLAMELIRGECSFMLQGKEVVRAVDIVWCKIKNSRNQFIMETERVYTDGQRRPVGKMLGGKRRPMEAISSAAKRIMEKELTVESDCIIIDESTLPESGVSEDVRESPSYPGIKSVYRVHIVPASLDLSKLDEDMQEDLLLNETTETSFQTREVTGDIHVFNWSSEEAVNASYKDAGKEGAALEEVSFDKVNAAESVFASLEPPVGEALTWTEPRLKTLLDNYNINNDNADGFNAVLSELKSGEMVLAENSSINALVGLKTITKARIAKDGQLLVDDSGALPQTINKPHENLVTCFKRIVGETGAESVAMKETKEVRFSKGKHEKLDSLPCVIKETFVSA